MSKLASAIRETALGGTSRSVAVRVIEFSLFGGIVTAMAAGVIRLH